MRRNTTKYLCYALLPVLSIIAVLGVSWWLAAFIELYTNNLTMLNILNRFTKQTANIETFSVKPPYPGRGLTNMFWFVQV